MPLPHSARGTLVLKPYMLYWSCWILTTSMTVNKPFENIPVCGTSQDFFFRLLPLSLRHFRRMSPSVLIRTCAVSDVEVAGSRVKTSVSLRRATCRGGHVEAVFFSPITGLIMAHPEHGVNQILLLICMYKFITRI